MIFYELEKLWQSISAAFNNLFERMDDPEYDSRQQEMSIMMRRWRISSVVIVSKSIPKSTSPQISSAPSPALVGLDAGAEAIFVLELMGET